MLTRQASSSAATSRLFKTALSSSYSRNQYPTIAKQSSSLTRSVHQSSSRPSTSSTEPWNMTSRNLSGLGVLSNIPDSLPEPDQDIPQEVPDHEWELRTGRAIYVIQETLPDFFQSGLIVSINKTTGTFRAASPTHILPTANINFHEHHFVLEDDDEAVYSPNVRLTYTPPVILPAPFPKTFHVEGQQLYLASSSFLKHTMNALYSDLHIQITKLVVNTPPVLSSTSESSSKKKRLNREKSLQVRLVVNGVARVSGKPGEWEIDATYSFSPSTGLIHEHTVNSIHPAPHQAVYDSLRLSFGKVLGLGWGSGSGGSTANGAACNGNLKSSSSPAS